MDEYMTMTVEEIIETLQTTEPKALNSNTALLGIGKRVLNIAYKETLSKEDATRIYDVAFSYIIRCIKTGTYVHSFPSALGILLFIPPFNSQRWSTIKKVRAIEGIETEYEEAIVGRVKELVKIEIRITPPEHFVGLLQSLTDAPPDGIEWTLQYIVEYGVDQSYNAFAEILQATHKAFQDALQEIKKRPDNTKKCFQYIEIIENALAESATFAKDMLVPPPKPKGPIFLGS